MIFEIYQNWYDSVKINGGYHCAKFERSDLFHRNTVDDSAGRKQINSFLYIHTKVTRSILHLIFKKLNM